MKLLEFFKANSFVFPALSIWLLFFANCQPGKSPQTIGIELLPAVDSPLVSFRFVLKLGSVNDPPGKEGICQLTLSMLANGGSQKMTYKEISEAFYPMAASFNVSVDKEMSAFYGTIHKDNLGTYYEIIKDMLLSPGFREEDFTRVKTNQINFLEKTLVSNMDEQFGKEILSLMLYEGHPYSHHPAGTVEALSSLTLDDVREFYRSHFLQGNIIIGLAGNFDDEFVKQVETDFSKLPRGRTQSVKLPLSRTPDGLEVFIAEKKTPATYISMGFPVNLTRAEKDFFALWIAGSHFGEHRQQLSWLFQKIREERGLNYGDYAYIEHFIQGRDKFPATNYCRRQQYFSIWIRGLANENNHFVIRQSLRELKKLVEEGISPERFELIRTYLLNYTRLYAQTLDERIGWKIDSKFYGYKDFLNQVQKVLPKLKLKDVNQAIKKYLDSNNVYIAIVTENAQDLKEALISNRPSPISYKNPNMPKSVLDEDLIIQGFQLNIKPEAVSIAPASEFFRRTGLPRTAESQQ